MISQEIKIKMAKLTNPEKAKILAGFFKTGKGQYGEGDKFLGIVVPQQREVAREYYKQAKLSDTANLLKSPYHEHRLTALIILTLKFPHASEKEQKQIFDFYLKNTKFINNWDLVDLTAPNIVGNWLLNRNRRIIHRLSKSKDLWEKRIAVLATFTFIRAEQFDDTLALAQSFLTDKHDLMHKAVGWMLREIGKRDIKVLEEFLKKYYKKMPRTMLRYAVEKFTENKRQRYLKKI